MNNILKHKFFTGIALLGTLFLGSACTDEWDDHYKDKGVNNNSQNLYELIVAAEDLQDFRQVIDSCHVSDSLFNNSRVYTLWAPVDGSFDKEALLAQAATPAGRDTVLVRFIESHLANYMHPANGELDNDNSVLLLNDKVVDFVGSTGAYKFDNIDIQNANIRARNGILHKINGFVPYRLNIWERIGQVENLSEVAKFLYSFDERIFDEYNSVVGPTINGEVTYLEEKYINSNMWFYTSGTKSTAGFGNLSKEDSSYVFFAPTNELWNSKVAEIDEYYNYYIAKGADTLYIDSMRNTNVRKSICNYLVFSDKEQVYANPGTMLSTFRYTDYSGFGSQSDEVRHHFDIDMLLSSVVDTEPEVLSNGKLYYLNQFKFSPYDIWFDTIKVEGEMMNEDWVKIDETTVDPIYSSVASSAQNDTIKGQISDDMYFTASPLQTVSRPNVTYTVPNTLSAGKYKIGVVVVPANITNKNMPASDIKPGKIRVQIKTRGADGKSTTLYDTNNGYKRTNDKNRKIAYNGLQNDPSRIDTVYLYDLDLDNANLGDPKKRVDTTFKFNFCEYGLTAKETATTITLTSDLEDAKEDVNYERTMRIDCILLIPVLDDEETAE